MEKPNRPTLQNYPRSQKAAILVTCCAVFVAAVVGFVMILQGGIYDDKQTTPQVPFEPKASASQTEVSLPAPAPAGNVLEQAQLTIPGIRRSMANCDLEAAKNPDDLYFLVTPVEPGNFETAVLPLPPEGDDYGTFVLVPSRILLGGLEDGSLTFSARPYEFSIVDIRTTQIKKWGSVNGPAKFSQPDWAELAKFQMGFAFGDQRQKWTNTYNRQKGNCYWINVRFPGLPYSPLNGSVNLDAPKRFPSPAATIRCANRVCERIPAEP